MTTQATLAGVGALQPMARLLATKFLFMLRRLATPGCCEKRYALLGAAVWRARGMTA